jgi:hypothetical protein
LIRDTITGSYDRAALDRLGESVNWDSLSPDQRRQEEEALNQLVVEARQTLDMDFDAIAVEIEGGEIVGIKVGDE